MNRLTSLGTACVVGLLLVACGGSEDASTGDSGSPPSDSGKDGYSPPTDGGADAGADAKSDATMPDGGADADTDGGACASGPPMGSLGAQSLQFTKLYLGDTKTDGTPSPTAWKDFGYDLDCKTTTSASTDVCTLAVGAPKSSQTDGTGGIDNSWGENIVPIFQAISGAGLSAAASMGSSYLVVDGTGKGGFAFTTNGVTMVIPLYVTHVVNSSGSGTISGVIDTEGFISNLKQVAGAISVSLCSGSTFDSIATQIRQANDIFLDGTNTSGSPCTGISFGIQFEGASSYSGSLPTIVTTCP